jgi:endoglycosylceramidase
MEEREEMAASSRVWRASASAIAWLVLLITIGVGSAQGAPAEPLGHAGRWITDARGRVVIVHGVNVVPSGFESPPERPGQAGFGADDIRFLATEGFDVVRLGMFYAGVEPRPSSYDASYLDHYERIQRMLAEAGIFTLLDMHQDQYARRYLGRGLPNWAVLDEGLPNTRQGFPTGYFFNPALNKAYDNFWANAVALDGQGLLDHYSRGWRRIAARFGDNPRVLGYDIFNEPWPGSVWPTCANPSGCPPGGFDQTKLTGFSRRTIAAIRRGDPRHLAFYEPNLQFDVGAATGHGSVGDPKAGFSFHDYCIGAAPGLPRLPDMFGLCETGEQRVFDNAEAHSRRTGAALLMTEFGDLIDPVIIERVANLADRNMVGWTYWSYLRGTGQLIRDPSRPPTPDNLHGDVLDVLVRPYPQAVAGTPERFRFDRDTRTFELVYSTARAGGGALSGTLETEIRVPKRQYPRGYRAKVTGGRIASAQNANLLRVVTLPGARKVSVRVLRRWRPVGGDDSRGSR